MGTLPKLAVVPPKTLAAASDPQGDSLVFNHSAPATEQPLIPGQSPLFGRRHPHPPNHDPFEQDPFGFNQFFGPPPPHAHRTERRQGQPPPWLPPQGDEDPNGFGPMGPMPPGGPNRSEDPEERGGLLSNLFKIGCSPLLLLLAPFALGMMIGDKVFGRKERPSTNALGLPQTNARQDIYVHHEGLQDKDTELKKLPQARVEKPKERLTDIAGIPEVVDEIRNNVVDMYKHHQLNFVGEELPKGLMFTGPPGTGKTLLAKAIAGELDVPFYSVSGSDFVEMYVGLGAARVRKLFEEVRKTGGIIFIDEIDAIGGKRDANNNGKGDSERVNTLNALLAEMDGFRNGQAESKDPTKPKKNVLVIAATNRPDILDDALRRPGRFDKTFSITPPMTPEARAEIFQVHARKKRFEPGIDFVDFSRKHLFPGTTGADIAKIVREAALIARKRLMPKLFDKTLTEAELIITADDLRKAVDLEHGTPKHGVKMDALSLDSLTRHEAIGHGLVAKALGFKSNFLTIVPRGTERGDVLGLLGHSPEDFPEFNKTREFSEKRMAITIGAQISEKLAYGEKGVSTGASGDLMTLNGLAQDALERYNLYPQLTKGVIINRGGALDGNKPAEDTLKKFDEYRQMIIDEIYRKTEAFLKQVPKEATDRIISAVKHKQTYNDPDEIRKLYDDPDTLKILKDKTGCASWADLWQKATKGMNKYTTV